MNCHELDFCHILLIGICRRGTLSLKHLIVSAEIMANVRHIQQEDDGQLNSSFEDENGDVQLD